MTTHVGMNGGNCAFSGTESNLPLDVTVFPNALSQEEIPKVQNNSSTPMLLMVYDSRGKIVHQQEIPPMNTSDIFLRMESGCYIFQFCTKEGSGIDSRKVMVLN